MKSSLISNTIEVYFDSVLEMDNEGMVAMFEALISSGLSGFLGCSSAIFETALLEFFHNASVRDCVVVSTIQGKPMPISEERFASTFELSLDGLSDLHEVPQDLVLEARRAFSYDGKLRKRTTGRTTPVSTDLSLVTVAQSAVPIQMISAVTHPAPKRKAPQRRLQLPAGSDDEIVEKEPNVVDVGEKRGKNMVTERTDMDTETVLAGIEHSFAVNDEDDNLDVAENEIARKMASFTAPKQFLKETLRSGEDDNISAVEQPSKTTDEESMSIEDLLKQIPDDAMMQPVTAEGPTRIKFVLGIQIPGVREVDPYTTSLPQIAATDKGKEPLVVETIQGNPAHEYSH
ncbi:splicing factor 3B subunit 1-like [Dorcoceras hygrometricum]|uniref:Splicing factor 3B subunit 1-like n=1 Tax=Dorcoceras hygrometricum TaxID=472368 RepID=A0A2Z7C0Q6_9LAMI|nr:splicing factor 3B subunit 1-like [Dorcoceras hygrometricum]